MTTLSKSQGLTGRHVLFALLAFFGVVFLVNGYFISVALSTYTGVVSAEPYRKGLHYNDRIAAAERQDALGWLETITLAPDGKRLSVVLSDHDGGPVRNLKLTASIGRPATVYEDVSVPLTETAPGHYEATLALAEPGVYIATVEARKDASQNDADVLYRMRKRLWVDR